jgi:hypothetical protein
MNGASYRPRPPSLPREPSMTTPGSAERESDIARQGYRSGSRSPYHDIGTMIIAAAVARGHLTTDEAAHCRASSVWGLKNPTGTTTQSVMRRRAKRSTNSIGASLGSTSACRGMKKVCSNANWPSNTAWGTASLKTNHVEPGGNSWRTTGAHEQ